ncbi:MAG: hypothetical protein JXO72_13685 [Vicinamibacteria bacterium]|nr:hypothetical protein [Vicinamibacteria bacterium]
MSADSESGAREHLRHTAATLAYRGRKVLCDAPEGFGSLKIGDTTRTSGEILAHIGDLLDWALSLAQGAHAWHESPPGKWEDGVRRFFTAIERFDGYLASQAPLGFPPEKLFQGPIADALTHLGQLSLLRRLAGSAVRGENYFMADIVAGRVGPDQAAPRYEFD